MRFPILLAALISAASPVAAQSAAVATTAAVATKGQMLSSADRARLGSVVRVNDDGSVAIIFDTRLLTVPASTLRLDNGKLTTSLSKHEIASLR